MYTGCQHIFFKSGEKTLQSVNTLVHMALNNLFGSFLSIYYCSVFSYSSVGKESACNAEDLGSIPGLGRHLGEGNGYPSQYSCLENSIDRGVWWAIVYGVAKNQTQLSE